MNVISAYARYKGTKWKNKKSKNPWRAALVSRASLVTSSAALHQAVAKVAPAPAAAAPASAGRGKRRSVKAED